MATRLGAAHREHRLAVLRLIGATPSQIGGLAVGEAAVAASVGAIGGSALFWASRPPLARIPLTGQVPFVADLVPPRTVVALITLLVPVAAGAAAARSLRRTQTSPLGVVRRVNPPAPTTARLVPLGLGLLILGLFALAGRPYDRGAAGTYAPTAIAGFVLVLVGPIVAGPWLTATTARLLATTTRRPAVLIALRRLQDDPTSAFRAVAGLVIAVFVGSVLIGAASTASRTTLGASPTDRSTIIIRASPPNTTAPSSEAAAVGQIRGVRGVTRLYDAGRTTADGYAAVVASCQDLRTTPAIGRCPQGSQTVLIPLYALDGGHTQPRAVWTPPDVQTHNPNQRLTAIVIVTDGAAATLERVRTAVAANAPFTLDPPATLDQMSAATHRDVIQLQHIADIAILISLLIAGASLAVAVAGGLVERRRPYSLLRLVGVPFQVLRRATIIETALPLCSAAAVAACSGLLTATLLLRAVRGSWMRPPPPAYYLTVLSGLATAVGIAMTTLPLLGRITRPENARTA